MNENGRITWTNEKRRLGDLIPWPINPRQIKEAEAQRLNESLDEFSQVETIAIGPEDTVYNGHQRLNVWMDEHGPDFEVDVRVSDRPLTEDERKKLTVFLHKGAAGEWDFDTLANNFEVDDLLDWGFSEMELDLDLWNDEPVEDPGVQMDRAEELRDLWQIERGQIWAIKSNTVNDYHRLICGDCTDSTVVSQVMNGERDYNVLTDPPYNIGFNYESIADEMTEEDYKEFCMTWFDVVSDAKCLIFTPGPKNERLYPKPRDRGYWLKRNASAGASAFHLRCVEPILIYGKIGAKRTFDYFDYSSGFPEELRAAQRAARVEDCHPPAKPAKLWEDLLSMLDDLPVLDLFLGNGTTLVACERLNRIGRGVEISPAYCAVAIQRLVDMGLEAELV